MRIIIVFALAVATQTSLAMADKLRIGTEGSYPPFNFVDSSGRLQGFDIELTQALCSRIKAECELVTQDYEGIVPALVAGKFDAAIASLWITDERKQKVDFTKPYYRAPARFAMRKGTAGMDDTSPAALKGRTLGAQSGTVHANYLQDIYQDSVIKLYGSEEEADAALAAGKLDAVLADGTALWRWLSQSREGRCCQFAGPSIRDPKWFGEGVAIAVRKGDTALKARFDKAIDAIVADGTYKAINDKYFPFSLD
jgi:polar amino acid transport system substrate-binding protein